MHLPLCAGGNTVFDPSKLGLIQPFPLSVLQSKGDIQGYCNPSAIMGNSSYSFNYFHYDIRSMGSKSLMPSGHYACLLCSSAIPVFSCCALSVSCHLSLYTAFILLVYLSSPALALPPLQDQKFLLSAFE